MRASHELSRVSVSFTEKNLVPNAGLLPAGALAQRIGLAELVEERVRLPAHGANSGTKALTVIGPMNAGHATAELAEAAEDRSCRHTCPTGTCSASTSFRVGLGRAGQHGE